MSKMPDFEGFFGRNVSYSKEKLAIYDKLQNDPLSPFKGRTMSEIFAYAAAFGFKKGRKEALRQAAPNISAVAFTDRQRAVLLSIAIQTAGDVDILFDPGMVGKTVNEYANGGIGILESELIGDVRGKADAVTKMASTMRGAIAEWDKNADATRDLENDVSRDG